MSIVPGEIANVHAPRLQQPAQRPQRPGDRRNPHRHLERGDRRPRLHAGQHGEVGPRSGGCAQGGGGDPGGEAAGDLCRHRRAMGRGLAAASRIRRTAGRAGHHQPRRQELVPGEPSAVARLGRQRGAEAGASLRREGRPDHRHRLLVHRDQLRHQVPQGEEVHPRHARSEPSEQGRGQRDRPGRRRGPDARCADRRAEADHQVQPRHQATWWRRSPRCARSGWRSGSRC